MLLINKKMFLLETQSKVQTTLNIACQKQYNTASFAITRWWSFITFSGKDHYRSDGKSNIWAQEQSTEEYQPQLSATTTQVQMVNDSPDSTKQGDTDKACSSIQEENEGSHQTQDPQQLIVSADELPKEKESTGGNPNSCTDTERSPKPATTACKQKKKADDTKPREKSATVEVLAVTQPDGNQGIASRCKCGVKWVFTIVCKYLLFP